MEAVEVDFGGVKGTPIVLGPVPSALGHGLVVHAGRPNAIWLGEGLELARLCP